MAGKPPAKKTRVTKPRADKPGAAKLLADKAEVGNPPADKTRRIRDPIHDLIVFDGLSKVDQIAWKLLGTFEFQRLRRIKQLGVSEFVFPGATHSRFAHCIGVFHNARRLLDLIHREIKLGRAEGTFNAERAEVAVLAALLHDLGHGPFSHAFEEARKSIAQRRSIPMKSHEKWTADMICHPSSQVRKILEGHRGGLAKEIADLISAENPSDMYHAVVSSSFDADRLDYVQRDRYMTGTGSAAIDLTWLMDNARVAHIDVSPSGDGDAIYTHSFCLDIRAREAAEDFLLARYRLYSGVYFHRVTRGMEQMLALVLRAVAAATEAGTTSTLGLDDSHPLVRHLAVGGDGDIAAYLSIDDSVVCDALRRIAETSDRSLGGTADVARRIIARRQPKSIDVQWVFPEDLERQRRLRHSLDNQFKDQLHTTVLRDEASLSLYGEIGADDTKAQKRLMILLPNGDPVEITTFRDAMVKGGPEKRPFLRYYFLNDSDHEAALRTVGEIKGAN